MRTPGDNRYFIKTLPLDILLALPKVTFTPRTSENIGRTSLDLSAREMVAIAQGGSIPNALPVIKDHATAAYAACIIPSPDISLAIGLRLSSIHLHIATMGRMVEKSRNSVCHLVFVCWLSKEGEYVVWYKARKSVGGEEVMEARELRKVEKVLICLFSSG
ncbi:hypothetical protein ASPWEDRAFT_34319 [Aspergillus wentii DTO 134E9]|uniref:Uncharacterized protein n=1 Tax=Aspergillus wentii DTO 134E9 TaxID=1073089 RepID=A0A1L9S144_ASPWE|nr:uncharacterized protein ASPWEDRAFT_34319 [Aspergillus wentii DTO 134E9]OJJ40848.1 hypothetical protein ASPWEDRAFT_34319 [Aspergillus wentii DTO 134E9]